MPLVLRHWAGAIQRIRSMATQKKEAYDELLATIQALQAENERLKQEKAQGGFRKSKAISPMNDPAYRAKCLEVKPKLAQYCKDTYGVELAHVFTSTSKVLPSYRNPVTGETWHSRGKMPAWLKGHEHEYKVQQGNGAAH